MAYKEMALSAQLSGAYSCATTVMVRTAARETIHRVTHADGSPKEGGCGTVAEGQTVNEGGAVSGRRNSTSAPLSFSRALPLEGVRCTFWLARCDGNIEIRLATAPDRVIGVVSHKTRSVVTSLLQLSNNRVVSGDTDGVLRVLDLITFQECQRIQAHKAAITCIVPVKVPTTHSSEEGVESPQVSIFLTASLDSSIARWDEVSLECLGRLKGRVGGFTALTASKSGTFAFSGGEDGSLRMWSLIDHIQVVGKVSARKKTVKKAAKGKETLSKSDLPTELQKKTKKKQMLLPNEKALGQISTTTTTAAAAAAPRRSSTPGTGRLSFIHTTRTLRLTSTSGAVGTVEVSKGKSRTMSASVSRRPFLAEKSVKTNNLGYVTPRIDLLAPDSVTEFPSSSSVAKVDADENDDEEDENEEEEDDGTHDDSDNNNKEGPDRSCQILSLQGTTEVTYRNLTSGSRGATSELNKDRKQLKVKKNKKHQPFDFVTVLQQLMGSSKEDPVVRQISAIHCLNGSDKHDAVLLWPLKHEHYQAITGLALVRDHLLVTASRDGVAKMFALPSGRMVCSVQRGRAALTSLLVDEARSLLWIGSADGSIAVYNVLHPDVVQVHGWRDMNTPYPRLVPLTPHATMNHLYLLSSFNGRILLNNPILKEKNLCTPAQFLQQDISLVKSSVGSAPQRNEFSESSPKAILTCVQLDDGDADTMVDVPLLRSLDRKFVELQTRRLEGGIRDAVFWRVLGRPVDSEGNELPEFLLTEKRKVLTALHSSFFRLLLQRTYFQWFAWRTRRVARYRRMRKVCFLATVQQESLLGSYFRRWRQRCTSTRRLLQHADMCTLERRVMSAKHDLVVERDMTDFARRLVHVFGVANHRCCLRRYYCKWFLYARTVRRTVLQSTAFNRLFLSFCDVKLTDASFIWTHVKSTTAVTQRRCRALWLLEQHMALDDYKRRDLYMKKWMQFVINQRDTRHSLILVETLSSVLVNELALRSRFFLKWYRFSLFEARIERLEEEKTTMQREWMAVQNAVDSTTTVHELRLEMGSLETSIAQLAFKRDEVESKNKAVRSEMMSLHMQKSIESLLALYRDVGVSLRRHRESGPVPRSKRVTLSACYRSTSLVDVDDLGGDWAALRQVGAVLGALKAAAIRFGRHSTLLSTAYERVLQLSICEFPPEALESGRSLSLCSTSGDSITVRNASNTLISEGKVLTGQKRSPAVSTMNMLTFLSDEFDRTTLRLQALIPDVARLTGVDPNEPSMQLQFPIVLEPRNSNLSSEMRTIDSVLLRNLDFVPPTTRTEVLPLIIDLIAMFDSVKAHSDMEVEGNGRGISTRGVPKIMPLPLRSLCKPQTAAWLIRNAAFFLELFSPGILQRHVRLRELNETVSESNNGACSGDATNSSPARSVGTVSSAVPYQSLRNVCPKLSMEKLNKSNKKYRSQSWSLSELRPHTSQLQLSPSNRLLNTTQRRILVPGSNSSTPRPQSQRGLREEDCDGQRPMPSFSTHTNYSGASTPTKSDYSSTSMRPYLGFRVTVVRNDAGNSTLTIHEVTKSYLSGIGGIEREGPAFAAGLRAGDQLVRFAGYTVTELAAFNAVVARHARPWTSIPVVFSRNDELISANIVVGEKARN